MTVVINYVIYICGNYFYSGCTGLNCIGIIRTLEAQCAMGTILHEPEIWKCIL